MHAVHALSALDNCLTLNLGWAWGCACTWLLTALYIAECGAALRRTAPRARGAQLPTPECSACVKARATQRLYTTNTQWDLSFCKPRCPRASE